MLLLYFLFVFFKVSSSSDATASPGEQIVDRLAVNLAGAFVKSIFPEMDKKLDNQDSISSTFSPPSEVRRAPINPFVNPVTGYSPMGSDINNIPQIPRESETSKNPFSYQPQLKAQEYGQTKELNNIGALALGGLANSDYSGVSTANGGTPEAINAIRNRAYLSELAKHQSELTAYSSKQMEYLDQQRRYQQAMIDHQAGAALLMQKQQQDIIAEQMKQMKQSYGMERNQENSHNDGQQTDFSVSDNTVDGKYLINRARGAKTLEVPTNRKLEDDDVITNDEYLKEYFKQKYNIEIPEDVNKLTKDEKATLRALKMELTRQKNKIKQNGVFATMNKLKPKIKKQETKKKLYEACDQCIPVNIKVLSGAWTQLYGNPNTVNKVFQTVMTLENLQANYDTVKITKKKTSCVGLEIGSPVNDVSSKVNMFFRDSQKGNELHEMRGIVKIQNHLINIETNLYRTQMCLVKVGPSGTNRSEYIVLSETTGKNSCRSYHVFVRNVAEFNRKHFDDVADFMKSESENILPVGAVPKPLLCELSMP